MLTSKHTKQIEIPHEPGEWLKVRQLSGRALDEAREERSRRVLANARAMGAEVMLAFQDVERPASTEPAEPDPLADYDVDTVLRCGIIAWSYQEKVKPETIADLDEQTRDWAAREILAMCQRSEADRKNS